ncbi:MAG: hypothetical protein RL318_938 [Fibrobacterota bacterium]|jgi:protein TonB
MSHATVNRLRRKGALAPPPRDLAWMTPPKRRFGWREVAIALGFLACNALFLSGAMMLPRDLLGSEEAILIQEDLPKPPEDVKPPPPPPPPPPEKPQEETPPPPDPNPPPPNTPPPPPQFGLPDGSTSDNGSFAVATGNTIMKKPEPVVKAPPVVQSLPPAPIAVTRPPDELVPVKPEYPEWALDQGVTAVVVAQVTIDMTGNVVDVRIVRSGGKDFDRSARAALGAARYRPYIKDGKAIPAIFERRFDFQLDN